MSDLLPNGVCRHNLTIKAGNLNGILRAAQVIMLEMDYARPDGSRIEELDHLNAIVSAAVDLSKHVLDLADRIGPMPD